MAPRSLRATTWTLALAAISAFTITDPPTGERALLGWTPHRQAGSSNLDWLTPTATSVPRGRSWASSALTTLRPRLTRRFRFVPTRLMARTPYSDGHRRSSGRAQHAESRVGCRLAHQLQRTRENPGVEHFERDPPIVPEVVGQVDRGHATAAQLEHVAVAEGVTQFGNCPLDHAETWGLEGRFESAWMGPS
jgi:hypothetical protein